ncbi:ABC transporter permease [Streptomyces coeruleorubidus]|uniref:ABC transporter permease n=1 Tax=Streptomyces coeruleorubidus TaxID=116188 RepID=UPI003796A9DC
MTSAPAPSAPMAASSGRLAGTSVLMRLFLRRDRIRLSLFVLLSVGLALSLAQSVLDTYGSAAERREYGEGTRGSALAAVFTGPDFGFQSEGRIVVSEMLTTVLLIVALGSAILTVRYTRSEEETGRAELVASCAVGRHARLSAAVLVVGLVTLMAGGLIAAALIGYGLPAAGSAALGLSVTAAGWLFAGIGAVTAQVFTHARTATGAALTVFGALFAARSVGDIDAYIGDPPGALRHLSWLSPLGWAHHVRAYSGERWWLLVLLMGLAMAFTGAAAALSVRRDVDAGLIPPRLGRARAGARLAGPWSLAWRLQRGGVIGTTAGIVLFSALFGSFAHEIDSMSTSEGTADAIRRLGGSSALTDSWLSWTLSVASMAAAAYAVAAVLRLRAEETGLRADLVLATAVERRRWAGGHLLCAVVGVTVQLAAAGLAVGVVHGVRSDDLASELPRLVGAGLVQVPVTLMMVGIAFLLFAAVPRFAAAGAWTVVVSALLLNQFGGLLGLQQQVLNLSPFTHSPDAPGSSISSVPLLWLGGTAVALTALGLALLRRRDINAG